MGGASGFLQLHSACSQHSLLLTHCTSLRNGRTARSRSKRSGVAVASLRQDGSGDEDGAVGSRRRAFLFVGVVVVLPLLHLPARAVGSLVAADEQRNTTISEEKKVEEV